MEKKLTKGTRCGQDQCNFAFKKFPQVGWLISATCTLRVDHSVQRELSPNHTLNTNITLVELFQALKKLQRNKAVGLDGMKAEFILDARKLLHMPLLTTFNYFLAKGFLEALSIGVVHALFKTGNASEFDNYMGITVGPILAKLFVMILDKRLSEWVEQHGLHAKGQARLCKRLPHY